MKFEWIEYNNTNLRNEISMKTDIIFNAILNVGKKKRTPHFVGIFCDVEVKCRQNLADSCRLQRTISAPKVSAESAER